MRSILVVNPKGGCGKTTIATNLSTYYAVWDMPVALVDLDPQQSALAWLGMRPDTETEIIGFDGREGTIYPPETTQRMIYDAPARTDTDKLVDLVKSVDRVIIPVLQSSMDIRATASFIAELAKALNRRRVKTPVAVVANRVSQHFSSFWILERFLKTLNIPTIGYLRNSQVYVRAADTGVGVFEMRPSAVDLDMKEWEPILDWIEGDKL